MNVREVAREDVADVLDLTHDDEDLSTEPEQSKKIGEILVERGVVESEDVDEALAVQKPLTDQKPLGELLTEKVWSAGRKWKVLLLSRLRQKNLNQQLRNHVRRWIRLLQLESLLKIRLSCGSCG